MNYNDYRSQYGGAVETIGGMLYDTNTYLTGATVALQYFTVLRANLALSNMELAGTLASPKAFLIRSIRVVVQQPIISSARTADGAIATGAFDNVVNLINTGVLTLTIGAKQYAQFQLWQLPAGSGVYAVQGVDGNTADPGGVVTIATNGEPDVRNVRTLSKPIFIGPQINFQATITWPVAIAIVGGVNPNIQVIFDGDLLRPVQ